MRLKRARERALNRLTRRAVLMKEINPNCKTGELSVAEALDPFPATGFVWVRNHVLLISAGTKRSTVFPPRPHGSERLANAQIWSCRCWTL